ncbi:MAG: hypothetical protein ACM3VZ_09180 [Acidobacteriota bacterium]
MIHRPALALPLLLVLSACASNTQTRVTDAAATPLTDLNLVRAEIPDVLAEARKQPYAAPSNVNCAHITQEIHKLDAVLGADLDAPPSDNTPSLLERGTDAAENSAIGAVQRTAEGLIPFRGWVRKLSGAERYSKKVSAAIAAGSVRRAFLKGFGASHGCTWNEPPQVASNTTAAPNTPPDSPPSVP